MNGYLQSLSQRAVQPVKAIRPALLPGTVGQSRKSESSTLERRNLEPLPDDDHPSTLVGPESLFDSARHPLHRDHPVREGSSLASESEPSPPPRPLTLQPQAADDRATVEGSEKRAGDQSELGAPLDAPWHPVTARDHEIVRPHPLADSVTAPAARGFDASLEERSQAAPFRGTRGADARDSVSTSETPPVHRLVAPYAERNSAPLGPITSASDSPPSSMPQPPKKQTVAVRKPESAPVDHGTEILPSTTIRPAASHSVPPPIVVSRPERGTPPETVVHVTIGRVEVRAAISEKSGTRPRPPQASPSQGLENFLQGSGRTT
jgi:hypothetical protein